MTNSTRPYPKAAAVLFLGGAVSAICFFLTGAKADQTPSFVHGVFAGMSIALLLASAVAFGNGLSSRP